MSKKTHMHRILPHDPGECLNLIFIQYFQPQQTTEFEHKNWFVSLEFYHVYHQAKGQCLQGNKQNKKAEAPAESSLTPKMYTFTGL